MYILKAIFFDFDGTLIDSESFHYSCWSNILNHFSCHLPYEEWNREYVGNHLIENCYKMKSRFDLPIAVEELIQWREQINASGFETTEIPLMPYAEETLSDFKKLGIKLALVTSSSSVEVDVILKRRGWHNFFDMIVTACDVTNKKPNPESYELCLLKMGCDKSECLVFEDSLTGLKAAKAANLICYVIQSNKQCHQDLLAADRIFINLLDASNFVTQQYNLVLL